MSTVLAVSDSIPPSSLALHKQSTASPLDGFCTDLQVGPAPQNSTFAPTCYAIPFTSSPTPHQTSSAIPSSFPGLSLRHRSHAPFLGLASRLVTCQLGAYCSAGTTVFSGVRSSVAHSASSLCLNRPASISATASASSPTAAAMQLELGRPLCSRERSGSQRVIVRWLG